MPYIKSTRVIKVDGFNQICVNDKELENLHVMYQVSEKLTKRVYKHEKVSAINQMIIDALVKADKYIYFIILYFMCFIFSYSYIFVNY